MEVLFAPDWRRGVPYQRLLAEALQAREVHVTFLQGYKRLLPLTRLLYPFAGRLLHLHWPEAYYPRLHDSWDLFRRARFVPDLILSSRRNPFVLTAHNLCEHNLQGLPFARANYAAACARARLIFAHSPIAGARLVEAYAVDERKIRVVPHGDLSVAMPPPAQGPQATLKAGNPCPRRCSASPSRYAFAAA